MRAGSSPPPCYCARRRLFFRLLRSRYCNLCAAIIWIPVRGVRVRRTRRARACVLLINALSITSRRRFFRVLFFINLKAKTVHDWVQHEATASAGRDSQDDKILLSSPRSRFFRFSPSRLKNTFNVIFQLKFISCFCPGGFARKMWFQQRREIDARQTFGSAQRKSDRPILYGRETAGCWPAARRVSVSTKL